MAKDIVIIPASGQIEFSGSSTHHNVLTVDSKSISITTDNFIIDGGNITAKNYIISSSVTHMTTSFSSGSTKFGDTNTDTHTFTGSLLVDGKIIPTSAATKDIGTSAKPFRDIYVSTGSIKFVQGGATIDTLDKDTWSNVKQGKFSDISGTGDIKISGSLLPSVNATKGGGFNLGSKSLRWSTIFAASTIDVSGSELHISPSASLAAGDDFKVVVSGTIEPANTGSDSLGSSTKPFKDLYVTTSSIKFVNEGSVQTEFSRDDANDWKTLKAAGATSTQWNYLKDGRFDQFASSKDWRIGSNLLPATTATKTGGFSLGNPSLRWSKLYVASHIDVSGSELIISAPSASAVGDDFKIVVSGTIEPANTGSDSLGSATKPFHDLYVTTSSIKFVNNGSVSTEFEMADAKDWKALKSAGATSTAWNYLKDGRFDQFASGKEWKIGSNLLPAVSAQKGSDIHWVLINLGGQKYLLHLI